MTREEAIEVLKKNRPGADPRRCGLELCTAVDMAISALRESENKRESDSQVTEPLRPNGLSDSEVSLGVEKQVTSDKRGRWLPQIVLGQRAWDCSECKTLGSPHWKWCPVCGARMEEA